MVDFIRGDRPNGYYTTSGGDGIKIEGETRQCVHCQFIWQHKPGSKRRYGVCRHCDGLICARQECFADQKKKLRDLRVEDKYGCLPCMHYNYLLMEVADKFSVTYGKLGKTFAINESGGLLLPTEQVKESKGSTMIFLS